MATSPAGFSSAVPARFLLTRDGGNPAFRCSVAAALVSQMPDSDLSLVPGLPHFAMTTAPEEFAHAALEWFATTAES